MGISVAMQHQNALLYELLAEIQLRLLLCHIFEVASGQTSRDPSDVALALASVVLLDLDSHGSLTQSDLLLEDLFG